MKGSYDKDAHEAVGKKRAALPKEQVFTQRNMNPLMDPKGVTFRESCDSAAYPESNAVMFVVDETGSMDHIPVYLAHEGLPQFMRYLYDGGLLVDPQLMLVGIGDAVQDTREQSPLQVGQFEAEGHLMDKWLTAIHLERKGGSNGGESYDMALYFAARHTKIDCFLKRGKKGYLFISGDEPHLDCVNAAAVRDRIGDDLQSDIPIQEIVDEASETYHCFFLVPDQTRARRCERPWRDVLGDNVIVQETEKDTAAVAAALIGLTEGSIASLDDLGPKLLSLGCDERQAARVRRCVESYASAIGRAGQSRPVQDDGEVKGKKRK